MIELGILVALVALPLLLLGDAKSKRPRVPMGSGHLSGKRRRRKAARR